MEYLDEYALSFIEPVNTTRKIVNSDSKIGP